MYTSVYMLTLNNKGKPTFSLPKSLNIELIKQKILIIVVHNATKKTKLCDHEK